tara:strand:+ start:949 stop:1548 length:600 start_codon:yes stop_codon:yes gene_type:complete
MSQNSTNRFKHKIIGISGNARSGKDTLGRNMVSILSDSGIKAKTFSFAHELKKSVDGFLLEQLGISAFTEDSDEKKIIRPFLVNWGTEIMRKKDSEHWIKSIEKKLSEDCVNIITDVRFENELDWVKEKDGLSVFLSRKGIAPANSYEEENNKLLSENVDLKFFIGNFEDEKLIMLTSNEILDKLINNDIFELWKATCH